MRFSYTMFAFNLCLKFYFSKMKFFLLNWNNWRFFFLFKNKIASATTYLKYFKDISRGKKFILIFGIEMDFQGFLKNPSRPRNYENHVFRVWNWNSACINVRAFVSEIRRLYQLSCIIVFKNRISLKIVFKSIATRLF